MNTCGEFTTIAHLPDDSIDDSNEDPLNRQPECEITNMMSSNLRRAAIATLLAASFGLANAADVSIVLTGDQEVPTVTTAAKGTGKITIAADKSVSGTITTTGITGTMTHIHEGAPGKNGPPIITLEKGADSAWSVPSGSKLTDAQYNSFKAGNLYVNVHSEEHKSGEIRAQLKP
jgi:hypothetical protein